MNSCFQYWKNFFHVAYFFIINKNERAAQFSLHFFSIGNKVGRQISTVKLHSFYSLNFGFSSFSFFHSYNTIFTHFLHCVSYQLTNFFIVVSRNRSHLFDFGIFSSNNFAVIFKVFNNLTNC